MYYTTYVLHYLCALLLTPSFAELGMWSLPPYFRPLSSAPTLALLLSLTFSHLLSLTFSRTFWLFLNPCHSLLLSVDFALERLLSF